MAIGFIREFSQAVTACAALCLLALSPCGYAAGAISLNAVFGEKALILNFSVVNSLKPFVLWEIISFTRKLQVGS